MTLRVFVLAAAVLALAACTTTPRRGGQVPPQGVLADAGEREAARATRLRAIRDWSFTGRIAVSNGRNGGSGRIEWRQQGDRYEVALSAPITRQSWRLTGGPDGARLEGLEGGTRQGPDAAGLLFQATGWDIPVTALADWLRGLQAEGAAEPKIEPGWDGRPVKIEQGGWSIDYEWPKQGDLPKRLDARRDQARVKLVVDTWQSAASADGNRDATRPELGFSEANKETLRRELEAVNLEDPSADVRIHIMRGDLRAVGICGYACFAPGMQSEEARSRGMRVLLGTSDAIEDGDHMALIVKAHRYARAYNTALHQWPNLQQSVPQSALEIPLGAE
jgi:outer membrane lipoprotein LolB